MLRLCSPDANWSEMIFYRDFCGSTTQRMESPTDFGAGWKCVWLLRAHTVHANSSRSVLAIQCPDDDVSGSKVLETASVYRRHCIFNWVVLGENEYTHASSRPYGHGLSCAVRMCAFTGIHRNFVNRYLSIFGTGKLAHAHCHRVHFIHATVSVCCVAFARIRDANDDDGNDDDEYLNWTIREWFLLCDRRKRISCAGTANAFASTLHSTRNGLIITIIIVISNGCWFLVISTAAAHKPGDTLCECEHAALYTGSVSATNPRTCNVALVCLYQKCDINSDGCWSQNKFYSVSYADSVPWPIRHDYFQSMRNRKKERTSNETIRCESEYK